MHPLARDNGLCPPCFRDPARPHQYGHLSLVRLVGILCIRCSNDSNLMRRILGLANPCNCLGQLRCDSVGSHDDNDASWRNDQHCLSWNTGSHLCSSWTLNWRQQSAVSQENSTYGLRVSNANSIKCFALTLCLPGLSRVTFYVNGR